MKFSTSAWTACHFAEGRHLMKQNGRPEANGPSTSPLAQRVGPTLKGSTIPFSSSASNRGHENPKSKFDRLTYCHSRLRRGSRCIKSNTFALQPACLARNEAHCLPNSNHLPVRRGRILHRSKQKSPLYSSTPAGTATQSLPKELVTCLIPTSIYQSL